MIEIHNQIVKCMVGACDETCIYYSEDHNGIYCASADNGLIDRVCKYFENIDKVKRDLKYYLDTNEELGVVYIPKFVIEKMIKEL